MPNRSSRILSLICLLIAARTVSAEPERPNADPPRWFVTLRVPPGTASRGAAMTIPVEVVEFQPRDLTQANEISFLMPQAATPDQDAPLRWDFAHGLGMLLRPDNPVPVRAWVLRPERMAAPSVKAMVGAASPKLRADADFQQKLKTLGVAVFGLKSGDNLSAVFPGVPFDAGPVKLGDKLEQLYYKSSFPSIPVEKVTAALPPNVTPESTYKLEAVDPVFAKALASDGIGSLGTGDGLQFAKDQLALAMNFGAGNADDKNHKRDVFNVKFDMGSIPRGDQSFADLSGKTTDTASADPTRIPVRMWPGANGDGIVDFPGWCQISANTAGQPENQLQVFTTLLASTDQAELRMELMQLIFRAWRMKLILTPASHTPTDDSYALTQTLMRLNEPLWNFLVLRRALKHCGPRLKVLGNELVPQLDPLSTRIWQNRYTTAESFVNSIDTVLDTYQDATGGLEGDSFHPLCGDKLSYEVNRLWLDAMRTDLTETFANPIAATPLSSEKIFAIQKTLGKKLLWLLSVGFHRRDRALPLAASLPAGRGKVTQDPRLEPDLVWLARACSGIAPGATAGATGFTFDSGKPENVNGFVRPFIIMSTSRIANNLKALVADNTVGLYFRQGTTVVLPSPVALPKDTYFRYLGNFFDLGPLVSALSLAKETCQPSTFSQRVKTDPEGKSANFSQDWFDNTFKKSDAVKAKPITADDLQTFDYLRLTAELETELKNMGRDNLLLSEQYIYVKKAANLTDGLVYAGTGTEGASSIAMRRAVQINLELIGKLFPASSVSTTDPAVQRTAAQKAFLEQTILAKALRPGNELMVDLWENVLDNFSIGTNNASSRLKTQGKLAATMVGADLILIKQNGSTISDEKQ